MRYDESSRARLEARARKVADWPARGQTRGMRSTSHLLFRVQGERLALPLTAVRAYVRRPKIARFPEAGVAVHGILLHEGRIVTVLALERLLGHASTAPAIAGAIVLDTQPDDVAIAIELEEGLEDLDVSEIARHEGILAATLPDGRGLLEVTAIARDPRGTIRQSSDGHGGNAGSEGNEG